LSVDPDRLLAYNMSPDEVVTPSARATSSVLRATVELGKLMRWFVEFGGSGRSRLGTYSVRSDGLQTRVRP